MIICKDNIFILETKNTHYVLGVDEHGYNHHLHWGKKCDVNDYFIKEGADENSNHTMLDNFKQEYTPFGQTMYRASAVKAVFSDGCRDIVLKYDGYEAQDNFLKLNFSDKAYPFEISLNYLIYENSDIITRWTSVKNNSKDSVYFEKLYSAEFNLPSKKPYIFKNTNGAWGGEFLETNVKLESGSFVSESRRGTSGHNQSPYFVAYQNADEKSGDVYFAALSYSGNFKVKAERDLFSTTRVILGMSDLDFSFELKAQEEFNTPKVFCGFTTGGFGDMTRQMNKFAINYVLPKSFNTKPLPVLYNSWEATYFDVSAENQKSLAEIAADIGVELFVMDDGWFGQRNNDDAGLGDWFVNKKKFPNGLDELIEHVNRLGMDFGIWVEPEMVNRNSDLYRAHPDWAYHFDKRQSCELRNQLVLNMTKPEVQEYIFNCINSLLNNHNIKYIKWDMNRPFSEAGGENLHCPQMLWYLHTKAVYDIVDKLKALHPDVAIESCASGGGRSDYGALSHFDQVWTSDNTDGIDRMVIQKGYSLLRPTKTMRAWVTDIAGINKPCSLDFRFNISMQGALGIGGNLTKYSKEDLEICKKNISLYKEIRDLVQFGNLYRNMDIDKDEILFNQYVNDEKTKSVAFIAANGTRFYKKNVPMLFDGLDSSKRYTFTFDNKTYEKSGAYLMNVGIELQVRGVDYNRIIIINEVK